MAGSKEGSMNGLFDNWGRYCFSHPAFYILVKSDEGKLMRALPNVRSSKGWTRIPLSDREFFDETGDLLPEFWGLERYRT